MKTTIAGLILLALAVPRVAQVGELCNADVTEKPSVNDPARAIEPAEGGWLAHSDSENGAVMLAELLSK